jgi:hypothetical protein
MASGGYGGGTGYYGADCCGGGAVASYGGGYYGADYYGGRYGMSRNRYGSYYGQTYYNPSGVYQSGYLAPNTALPANGVVPAGATIDPKTGLPVTPRTVPNPMPDKDK